MKKEVIKKKEVQKPTSIGFKESEKEIIKNAAQKKGVTFNSFVRQSALHIANQA